MVRKNSVYTALVCFLAFNLLFNQVALNFFHNKHDAHKSYQTQSEQDQFNSHGEHCKVCALDTLFHLYVETPPEFHFYQPEDTAVSIPVLAQVIASGYPINGRAPPFSI
jgi:hypothetical protein